MRSAPKRNPHLLMMCLGLALGCEIERLPPPAPKASNQQGDPATAPASLSAALSSDRASPARVVAEAVGGGPQAEPGKTEGQPALEAQGPPLPAFPGWLEAPPEGASGTWFIYGGGVPVASLKLPEKGDVRGDLVVAVMAELEAQKTTNAGVGAALRLDGSIEVESWFQDELGRGGRVFGVHDLPQPVRLAAALARAGGAELHGRAAEGLARKLKLPAAPLDVETATQNYLFDLGQLLRGDESEAPAAATLRQLFVPPEDLARALALEPRSVPAPPRDPLVVVAVTQRGLAFAVSHGGAPLSLPGAPSLLEDDNLVSATGERLAFLLPRGDCPLRAAELVASASFETAIARVAAKCPLALYALVEAGRVLSNLPPELTIVYPSAAVAEAPTARARPATPKTPPSAPPGEAQPQGAESQGSEPRGVTTPLVAPRSTAPGAPAGAGAPAGSGGRTAAP